MATPMLVRPVVIGSAKIRALVVTVVRCCYCEWHNAVPPKAEGEDPLPRLVRCSKCKRTFLAMRIRSSVTPIELGPSARKFYKRRTT